MYRKETSEKSPLRILERSMHGGLGPGNLGVVMARAGIGKTAFLVHVGVDDALRERNVLHVSLGQKLEHTLGWYNTLLDAMVQATQDSPYDLHEGVARRRLIQSFPDHDLSPEKLRKVIELYSGALAYQPSTILVDGYPWGDTSVENRTRLAGLKAVAGELKAELWMSAQTHREQTSEHPKEVPPPCAEHLDMIDVAVFLESQGNHVTVRLLKDHTNPTVADTRLELDPVNLCLTGKR